MIWLKLESDPPRAFYRAQGRRADVDCDLAWPALVASGTLRAALSRPGAPGANASLAAVLDNAAGRLTAEFAVPPLRAVARLMDGATELFAGVVTGIEMGATITVRIEAGTAQPLSMPVPLRSTTVWDAFRDPETLPLVFGPATLAPVQYSEDRRVWLVADHAVQGIDRVERDDVATAAWAWRNTTDGTGHPVALLELAEPLAEGERLAVRVRGAMHPTRGTLMERQDEIVWYLLAEVCGLDIDEAYLDALRGADAGVTLGGVIDDAERTARATVDVILASSGAAWSAAARDIAIPWPPEDHAEEWAEVVCDAQHAQDVTVTCADEDLVTELRVLYDYDWSTGKHRGALVLEADADTLARHGRILGELDAGWLHSARHAEARGRAYLANAARPAWAIQWVADLRDSVPAPGAWAGIDHWLAPVSGTYRLVQADIDTDKMAATLAVSVPAGAAPEIRVKSRASAFAPLIVAGASVVYQDGRATFTILDDAGQPLAGATVTLDGGAARRLTDSAGHVTFTAARGAHVLLVEAAGYADMQIEVVL